MILLCNANTASGEICQVQNSSNNKRLHWRFIVYACDRKGVCVRHTVSRTCTTQLQSFEEKLSTLTIIVFLLHRAHTQHHKRNAQLTITCIVKFPTDCCCSSSTQYFAPCPDDVKQMWDHARRSLSLSVLWFFSLVIFQRNNIWLLSRGRISYALWWFANFE